MVAKFATQEALVLAAANTRDGVFILAMGTMGLHQVGTTTDVTFNGASLKPATRHVVTQQMTVTALADNWLITHDNDCAHGPKHMDASFCSTSSNGTIRVDQSQTNHGFVLAHHVLDLALPVR